MANTISKRQADGRNYTYNQINKFRCKACKGRAVVEDGRIRVDHSDSCEVLRRLVLTRPGFLATLVRYRSIASS